AYCKTLQSGRVNPKAKIKVLQRSPATALVDGDDGIGHLVMTYATNLAIELARESGIGWVGTRHSNHARAAGISAAMPVEDGMVASEAAVPRINHRPQWGGAERFLEPNPIAAAIPAAKEAPILRETAPRFSPHATLRQYIIRNEPLPEGWVVHSKTGEPVTD